MVFPFSYPDIFLGFLAWLSLPVDLSLSLGMECIDDRVSFYVRLVTTTTVPLLVNALVLGHGMAQQEPKKRARAFLIVSLIVYLLVPGTSTVIFRTFDCERFDDGD